ncbi:MAG: hypothetical protein K9G59_11615 [Caulobacter sp.]|nr:hypothetical protein [Caulobacter sp.]
MSASGLALGLLAATVIAASAPVPPAGLEPAFGNTIITTYPNGKSTRTWLHRDGTYEAQRANGERTGGVWKVKGGQLCITQKRPVFVPLTFCTPIVPGGVGASWSAKGLLGEPVRNVLAAGRQG